MKKISNQLLFICLLLAAMNYVSAQQQTTAEGIQARKVEFFNQELNLTSKEEREFWNVYDEYTAKKDQINKQRNSLIQYYEQNENNLSEAESADLLSKFIGYQTQEAKLLDDYTKKFKEFLPDAKVIKIYTTEIEFRRWLLTQNIQPRPNR